MTTAPDTPLRMETRLRELLIAKLPLANQAGMEYGIDAQIEHLLPAILPLLRETAWQPMSSAPKDGGFVLLYCVPDWEQKGYYAIGAWRDSYGGSWWDRGMEYTFTNPTHWMPLPSIPEEPR